MFDAIEPLLFQEGEQVCMFYRSNRFQLGASQDNDKRGTVFQLWSTRTHDGVHWTRPVPVRSAVFSFAPRTNSGSCDRSSLVRTRDGTFSLLCDMKILQGIGPGRLPEESNLECWEQGWPRYIANSMLVSSAALCDSSEIYHFFGCWSTGDVYYCQPRNLAHPPSPVTLFKSDATIRSLLPVVSGRRFLLFCGSDTKVVLCGGTIEADREVAASRWYCQG